MDGFDYSRSGAYFVTVCTKNRECLFGDVGEESISARMIEETFRETIEQFPSIDSPKYTIMPNHFHAIIINIRADMESAPTLPEIIQSFKRNSTIEYIKLVNQGILPRFDKQIWQRSFYDHIIRNEEDFLKIWQYIEDNPIKWEEDTLYVKSY